MKFVFLSFVLFPLLLNLVHSASLSVSPERIEADLSRGEKSKELVLYNPTDMPVNYRMEYNKSFFSIDNDYGVLGPGRKNRLNIDFFDSGTGEADVPIRIFFGNAILGELDEQMGFITSMRINVHIEYDDEEPVDIGFGYGMVVAITLVLIGGIVFLLR